MASAPKKDATVTIRCDARQKAEWVDRARRAGMSLARYIGCVMDRTDLVVSTKTRQERTSDGRPPRR